MVSRPNASNSVLVKSGELLGNPYNANGQSAAKNVECVVCRCDPLDGRVK